MFQDGLISCFLILHFLFPMCNDHDNGNDNDIIIIIINGPTEGCALEVCG